MTISWKSLFPTTISTTSKAVGIGAAFGAGAALLVCAAAWLSPLAAADRPVLALMAVTLALPLGAAASARGVTTGEGLLRGAFAAGVFATLLTMFTPAIWIAALLWCVPAALIGAALAGISRTLAMAAALIWLMLGGLPFFFESVPVFQATFADWAISGCPWLGFSQDAFGGDPLRRGVIYLGQLSGLTDQPAEGFLTAGPLWIAATLAAIAHAAATWRSRSVEASPAR